MTRLNPEALSKCDGRCCELFALSKPHEHLIAHQTDIQDGETIAGMVISQGQSNDGVWLFSCQHFDTDSRRCRIYEQRPDMCRRYPYDGRCGFCGYVESVEHSSERVVFPYDVGVTLSGHAGWYTLADGTKVRGSRRLIEAFALI